MRSSFSATPSPSGGARPGAKCVLLVEDDEDLRRMLAKKLTSSYAVYEARNGIEALHILENIQPPDLIVTDVMMPHLDGFEMARTLKSDRSMNRVPIIFLTARDGAMDVVEGINSGARHYMTKPFKMADLMTRVTKILGH